MVRSAQVIGVLTASSLARARSEAIMLLAERDAGARAAVLLNEERLRRPAGLPHGLGDAVRLRVLAAETDAEHAADVGMRGQRQHEADGVVVVVAAGEADDVHVRLAFGDLLRHEARALHGVDHEQVIADAFAAVACEG